MKKILPFLFILLILLVAGGLFIESKRGEESVLSSIFNQTGAPEEKNEKPAEPTKPKFTNQGPAPELVGITKWLNTEKPLVIAELQGNVVLIDFWTYSCINCIRTLPFVTKWYEKYKDQGLVIIGVHTPEFAFEKVTSNVETSLKRYGITYPVAQDNNYKTWSAYKNQFWPAHYLIDKNGEIVYTHFGEGKYDETELAIRTLLGLEGEFEMPNQESPNQAGTPEIYLGSARLANFGGSESPTPNTEQIYAFPKKLAKNKFALEGRWKFEPEAVTHTEGFGRIRLNFNASKVFMVAQSQEPTTIKIYVDGKLHKGVTVTGSDLYSLYESSVGANHTMEIEFPRGGVQVFTFTFG